MSQVQLRSLIHSAKSPDLEMLIGGDNVKRPANKV